LAEDLMARLLHAVTRLHLWREDMNGEQMGRGKDPYAPDEDFEYAEAYAVWGTGYLRLFEYTHREKYLGLAKCAADWLVQSRYTNYEHLAWGLPWSWQRRQAPPGQAYVTTTAFAGNLFLSLYLATHETVYLEFARDVARWISEENGHTQESTGIWFHYTDHSSFQFPICNATSLASGFLARLYMVSQEDKWNRLVESSMTWLLSQQQKNGAWVYSTERPRIDNLHTGFTIEGLCQAATFLDDSVIGSSILRATHFYWNNLYQDSGYGSNVLDYSLAYRLARWFGVVDPEAPLWAYAAGIRAFTLAASICDIPNYTLPVVAYVLGNLQREDGAFKFRARDPRAFIRHEAHIFDALCANLLSMSKSDQDG
jgi:hypothetical protein